MAITLGGIIGFFSALCIDIARRQYELKEQVYLDTLDALSESMKFWAKKKTEETTATDDFYNTAFKFQLSIYKFKLCGCSKEVYDIMDRKLTEPDSFKNLKDTHDIILKELIPAFERDLTRWWQFWR